MHHVQADQVSLFGIKFGTNIVCGVHYALVLYYALC